MTHWNMSLFSTLGEYVAVAPLKVPLPALETDPFFPTLSHAEARTPSVPVTLSLTVPPLF